MIRSLTARRNVLCFATQSLVEFWNVSTRPAKNNGLGLSVAATEERAGLVESEFLLLKDTDLVHSHWRRLVVAHSVRGIQVHDARLVAAMLAHGVTHLLTLNDRDFARYPEITALHPANVPVQ